MPGQRRVLPSYFCERCRAERADPFWAPVVTNLMPPGKLKPTGKNALVRGVQALCVSWQKAHAKSSSVPFQLWELNPAFTLLVSKPFSAVTQEATCM